MHCWTPKSPRSVGPILPVSSVVHQSKVLARQRRRRALQALQPPRFECEFKEHHRGRKPKKRQEAKPTAPAAMRRISWKTTKQRLLRFPAKLHRLTSSCQPRELSRSPPPRARQAVTIMSYVRKGGIQPLRGNEPAPKLPSPKDRSTEDGSALSPAYPCLSRFIVPSQVPVAIDRAALASASSTAVTNLSSNSVARITRSRCELPPLTMPSRHSPIATVSVQAIT